MTRLIDKRMAPLLDELERQGWSIRPSKGGWMVYPPDPSKPGVVIHKTPSDRRAWNNMLTRLRRSGYQAR